MRINFSCIGVTCCNCRFWAAAKRECGEGVGVCERFPPSIGPSNHWQFAMVPRSRTRCGEWAERDGHMMRHWPSQVYDILVRNGFTTIADVMSANPKDLLALDGIGPKRLAQIRDNLRFTALYTTKSRARWWEDE